MENKAFNEAPYYGVTLVISEPDLPEGKLRIVGFFYPDGFCGRREKQFSFDIDENEKRVAYEVPYKLAFKKYGNTIQGSNHFFNMMKNAYQHLSKNIINKIN